MVKHLSTVRETRVRSLGWEDPLEKEMATHSSVLAWRIPEMAEPGGLPSMGWHRVRHDWSDLAAAAAAAAMRETRVRSLGWEDPLEKEMAIHYRTIAWKIPWTEEPVGYSYLILPIHPHIHLSIQPASHPTVYSSLVSKYKCSSTFYISHSFFIS